MTQVSIKLDQYFLYKYNRLFPANYIYALLVPDFLANELSENYQSRHQNQEDLDAVWTLSETESKSHPLKQLSVHEGFLNYYDPKGKDIIARQQLETVYHRNGIAYVLKRDVILNSKTIKGSNCGALICEGDFISIDTEKDLELTNYFLKK